MISYVAFYAITLCAGLMIRRKIATGIFLLLVFAFVGLRKDTGFDLLVYQEVFAGLAEDFSLESIAYFTALYRQEIGFLFFTGALAQIIPNYEFYQATISVLLIWSTVKLARSVGVQRTAMVVALSMSYLLWSVGFSTLRQSLAISFFNFGLALILRGNKYPGVCLFLISPLFHTSALIYITAYLSTLVLYRKQKPPKARSFVFVVLASATAIPLLIQVASSVSSSVALRVEWYRSFQFSFGMLDSLFLGFFLLCALLATKKMSSASKSNEASIKTRQLLLVMAAIGASAIFFPIVRDRVSYEIFVLASICVMAPDMRYRSVFVAALASFGIFISSINIFSSPNNLVFVPYQNIIALELAATESTGRARNQEFMSRFDEIMFQ